MAFYKWQPKLLSREQVHAHWEPLYVSAMTEFGRQMGNETSKGKLSKEVLRELDRQYKLLASELAIQAALKLVPERNLPEAKLHAKNFLQRLDSTSQVRQDADKDELLHKHYSKLVLTAQGLNRIRFAKTINAGLNNYLSMFREFDGHPRPRQ